MSGIDAVHDLERQMLEGDEDGAYAYLLESWVSSCAAKLREARRREGLTQEEVAERLNTKQPAIARLEKDHEGRFSLRRFAEYALACGLLPLEVPLEPSEEVRRFALNDATTPRTWESVEGWRREVRASSYAKLADEFLSVTHNNRPTVVFEELHEDFREWNYRPKNIACEKVFHNYSVTFENEAVTVQKPAKSVRSEKKSETGATQPPTGVAA